MKNRAGLDALSLRLLAEDLAPLDELADNLASRVMRYLLQGAGAEIQGAEESKHNLVRSAHALVDRAHGQSV